MISLQESIIKFSPNIPQHIKATYKTILWMEARSSFGTYLGTLVDIQPSKTSHFTFFLDKISNTISYCIKTLSKSAKLILINSVLVASISHILGVFRISGSITNKIDAMIARFFVQITKEKV